MKKKKKTKHLTSQLLDRTAIFASMSYSMTSLLGLSYPVLLDFQTNAYDTQYKNQSYVTAHQYKIIENTG